MMELRISKLSIWLLALLAASAVQASYLPSKLNCARHCNVKDNSIFGLVKSSGSESSVDFELGKTYVFDVKTANEAHTLFDYAVEQEGVSEAEAAEQSLKEKLIEMEAKALITAVNQCEVSMKLRQIRLNFQDAQSSIEDDEEVGRLVRQLEKPIMFAYKNGIVSEVCSEEDEEPFVVNIKKSIISALQTTPQISSTTESVKLVETDFHGDCETEYKVYKQSWNKFVVTKEKDLKKCLNSEEAKYEQKSKSLLERNLNSTAKCEQVIEAKQIKQVECVSSRELNTVMPHFNVELVSRVQLVAEQVYQAREQELIEPAARQWTRNMHRLMMSPVEHQHEQNEKYHQRYPKLADGRTELKTILDRICTDIKQNGNRVGYKTAEFVRQLAAIFHQCTAADVDFVWTNLVAKHTVCDSQSKKVKDLFVDTAASVMNRNVVRVVREELLELLSRPEPVSQRRARYLASAVAFASEPTAEAVRQLVTPDLFVKIDDAHIILSLSALVKKTKLDKQSTIDEVKFYERLYESVVEKVLRKSNDPRKETETVRLLKALENIAPETEIDAQHRLVPVIKSTSVPELVRFSAIKSLEGIRMSEKLRRVLMSLFEDRSEKNEIRIIAYRTLVNSEVTVDELRQILAVVKREQDSNQDIYNYVCSHQKNLRTTDDIKKRALLPLEAPLFPEPQSITHLLLSRNYEWSFVDPKISIGGIVEADVVMPKESRLPRLLTFNLTVPVADKQISVVELTLRQEGLERSAIEMVEQIKKIAKNPSTMVRELSKIVRQQQQQKTDDKVKIQLLANIDGKNVFVWDSTESKFEDQKQWDDIWAQLVKQVPIRIDETMVVMPLKHRVPIHTASGIPVTFELNTTLVCSFESTIVGQKSAGGDRYFELMLKPTVVAEFSAGLEADIYSMIEKRKPKQIQLVSRLIAAPTMHLKAEVKEGKELRVKFLLPEPEQTIVRVETEFNRDHQRRSIEDRATMKSLVEQQQQYRKQPYGLKDEQERCVPLMERVFGFTFCYRHHSITDLKRALSRKDATQLVYHSELRLLKTDRQMEGIEMRIELPESIIDRRAPITDKKELKFVFSFDTPNSATPRHYATEVLVHIPREQNDRFQVKVDLASPTKKYNGHLVLVNEPREKSVKIELVSDQNQRQFLLEAGALIDIKDIKRDVNLKMKLRLQPFERSKIIDLSGEFELSNPNGDKKNVHLKLEHNQKPLLDMTLIKSGYLLKPVDCKLSADFKLDLAGAKVQTSAVVNKNHQTGTIKSTAQIRYNRFLTRRDAELESIDFDFQYTGFNQPSDEIKKFVHWSMTSTQYPKLDSELTYHIKGQLAKELTQELVFKWTKQPNKLIRVTHQTRSLQNPRNRYNEKYDTQVEVEITPLGIKYGGSCIVDLTKEPTMRFEVDAKIEDRIQKRMAVEAHFVYSRASKQPLTLEAVGEVKLFDGKYRFLYKDSVREVKPGQYEGKTELELPRYQHPTLKSTIPKRIELVYRYQAKEELPSRSENLIVFLVKKLERFEHQLTVENEVYGQLRHDGLIAIDRQDRVELKSSLQHNQQQLYKSEIELMPTEKNCKLVFETSKFDHLQVEAELHLKRPFKWHFGFRTEKYQHRTVFNLDPRDQFDYELLSQTQKQSRDVLVIEAKKRDQLVQIAIRSKWAVGQVELKNLRQIVKVVKVSKRATPDEESYAKIELELPVIELEHKSQLNYDAASRQLALVSETRKHQRNWAKFNIKFDPIFKKIDFELLDGNVGSFKLTTTPDQYRHELEIVLLSSRKSLSHKTVASWEFVPRRIGFGGDFKLLSVDTKNHMTDKALFDLSYRRNADNQQYVHQLTVSTRDSHLEFASSKFDRSTEPKAILIIKTKKFGGVEHKTELKRVDLEAKTFQLYSNTVRANRVLVEIVCDLALKKGKQSTVKIDLADHQHKIDISFVPFEQAEVQAFIASRWDTKAKFERKNRKHWTVETETVDRKQNDRWTVKCEHRCDQFTIVTLESPIVRGNVEIRLPEKTFHLEMKGFKQLRGLQHKTDARLNWHEKQLELQSETIKSDRPFLLINGQFFLDLYKSSVLKVEIEPIHFKIAVQCDPQTGGRVQLAAKQLTHNFEIKKRAGERSAVSIVSETRHEDKVLLLIETDVSPRKVEFKCELGWRRFPATMKGKVDLIARELYFESHDRRSDRVVKVEAKARDLKNLYLECAWDARRDAAKKLVIEVRVQGRETAGDRLVATVKGELIGRVFEGKVDFDYRNPIHGSHRLTGEYKNRANGDEMATVKLSHQYQGAESVCHTVVECRHNQKIVLKGEMKLKVQPKKRSFQLELNTESELTETISETLDDLLNLHLKMSRDCESNTECRQQALIKYGKKESTEAKKEISFESHNDSKEIAAKLTISHPAIEAGQTFKFEWTKQDSKLQLNIYNTAGRQLDVNVDVAKALQKKFQIVSFIDSIPTVDIEAAYGENSRIVFAVSFKQEKKMELSLNWFGQWRRDFKLEALFRCFSKPGFEMMIVSRHPAGMDQIDGVLKIQDKEYSAKWSRKFDVDSKLNWNTQVVLVANGQKKVDIELECQNREVVERSRQVVVYKARMDGVYQATGHVEFVFRASPKAARFLGKSQLIALEKAKVEIVKRQQPVCNAELYLGYQENESAPVQTGLKIELDQPQKPILSVIYVTEPETSGADRRTSMLHVQLPADIEYLLRNEIHYRGGNQIKLIRSLLQKKGSEPIYQMEIVADEDRREEMKVLRVEIRSARFADKTPKLVEIRYNFDAKQCKIEEEQFGHQVSNKKCIRLEVIAGAEETAEKKIEKGVKLGLELMRNRIEGATESHNNTIRFSIESLLGEQKQYQQQQQDEPINFTATAHASIYSQGFQWENINRFGVEKAGQLYLGYQPKTEMVDWVVRSENRAQPSKSYGFDVHFSPKAVRRTLKMNVDWDQEKLRQKIVGQLPRIEQLSDQHLGEIEAKMVRELKEEVRHKLSALKESFELEELVEPIVAEVKEVERRMETSDQKVVRQLAKAGKQMVKRADQLWSEIDLEQWVAEIAYQMDRQVEEVKRALVSKLEQQCDKIDTCRSLVDQLRDYEIKKFVERAIVKRADKWQHKMEQYLPKAVVEAFQDLHQIVDDQQEEVTTGMSRRPIRHLLKMSPPVAEDLIQHLGDIAKQFVPKQQKQNVNWPAVRGSFHDMAIDMIDSWQPKSTKQYEEEEEETKFRMPFFGGYQNRSPYEYQKKQVDEEANKYQQVLEPKIFNNIIFSPKRGQLKWLDAITGETKGAATNYWTRS